MRIKNEIVKILEIDWLKTIRFNLHYFSLKDAICFPCLVYWKTNVKNWGGHIYLDGTTRFGLLRLGIPSLGMQDRSYSRTVWNVSGKIVIKGLTYIGRGTRICVMQEGKLILGDNFRVTGDTTFVCKKSIKFGNQCLLSWDIQIMDTDFHKIVTLGDETKVINADCPIVFGDGVWVGCRSTILKGSEIPNDSVIAAGTVVSGRLPKANTIYGGLGKDLKILKENVKRII